MARLTRNRSGRSAVLLAIALLVTSCSSGDDSSGPAEVSDPGTTTVTTAVADASDETTSTTAPVEIEGSAPGVTDSSVKIGVNFVDTEALRAVGFNFELGDHRAVYQALVDEINDADGIHGRRIELVFAPIDPTTPESADEACARLTEDEDVFLITGFFLADAVLCPLELHATAVVGGAMTPDRTARADVPWVAWEPDTEEIATIVRALHAQGELDGRIAVYAAAADQLILETEVLPALDQLGVVPVVTAVMDAPSGDVIALQNSINIVSERFSTAEADTILIVGASGATWPQYQQDNAGYRPDLLFMDIAAARAFATSAATTDTGILVGSLSAGGYGPDQARFDESAMQACVATLGAAGIATPAPDEFDADDVSNQPYQAAFQACPDVALVRALLLAAGPDLDYAALHDGLDGLTVGIPGDPIERTYGPVPSADGDPAAYFYAWDPVAKGFVAIID